MDGVWNPPGGGDGVEDDLWNDGGNNWNELEDAIEEGAGLEANMVNNDFAQFQNFELGDQQQMDFNFAGGVFGPVLNAHQAQGFIAAFQKKLLTTEMSDIDKKTVLDAGRLTNPPYSIAECRNVCGDLIIRYKETDNGNLPFSKPKLVSGLLDQMAQVRLEDRHSSGLNNCIHLLDKNSNSGALVAANRAKLLMGKLGVCVDFQEKKMKEEHDSLLPPHMRVYSSLMQVYTIFATKLWKQFNFQYIEAAAAWCDSNKGLMNKFILDAPPGLTSEDLLDEDRQLRMCGNFLIETVQNHKQDPTLYKRLESAISQRVLGQLRHNLLEPLMPAFAEWETRASRVTTIAIWMCIQTAMMSFHSGNALKTVIDALNRGHLAAIEARRTPHGGRVSILEPAPDSISKAFAGHTPFPQSDASVLRPNRLDFAGNKRPADQYKEALGLGRGEQAARNFLVHGSSVPSAKNTLVIQNANTGEASLKRRKPVPEESGNKQQKEVFIKQELLSSSSSSSRSASSSTSSSNSSALSSAVKASTSQAKAFSLNHNSAAIRDLHNINKAHQNTHRQGVSQFVTIEQDAGVVSGLTSAKLQQNYITGEEIKITKNHKYQEGDNTTVQVDENLQQQKNKDIDDAMHLANNKKQNKLDVDIENINNQIGEKPNHIDLDEGLAPEEWETCLEAPFIDMDTQQRQGSIPMISTNDPDYVAESRHFKLWTDDEVDELCQWKYFEEAHTSMNVTIYLPDGTVDPNGCKFRATSSMIWIITGTLKNVVDYTNVTRVMKLVERNDAARAAFLKAVASRQNSSTKTDQEAALEHLRQEQALDAYAEKLAKEDENEKSSSRASNSTAASKKNKNSRRGSVSSATGADNIMHMHQKAEKGSSAVPAATSSAHVSATTTTGTSTTTTSVSASSTKAGKGKQLSKQKGETAGNGKASHMEGKGSAPLVLGFAEVVEAPATAKQVRFTNQIFASPPGQTMKNKSKDIVMEQKQEAKDNAKYPFGGQEVEYKIREFDDEENMPDAAIIDTPDVWQGHRYKPVKTEVREFIQGLDMRKREEAEAAHKGKGKGVSSFDLSAVSPHYHPERRLATEHDAALIPEALRMRDSKGNCYWYPIEHRDRLAEGFDLELTLHEVLPYLFGTNENARKCMRPLQYMKGNIMAMIFGWDIHKNVKINVEDMDAVMDASKELQRIATALDTWPKQLTLTEEMFPNANIDIYAIKWLMLNGNQSLTQNVLAQASLVRWAATASEMKCNFRAPFLAVDDLQETENKTPKNPAIMIWFEEMSTLDVKQFEGLFRRSALDASKKKGGKKGGGKAKKGKGKKGNFAAAAAASGASRDIAIIRLLAAVSLAKAIYQVYRSVVTYTEVHTYVCPQQIALTLRECQDLMNELANCGNPAGPAVLDEITQNLKTLNGYRKLCFDWLADRTKNTEGETKVEEIKRLVIETSAAQGALPGQALARRNELTGLKNLYPNFEELLLQLCTQALDMVQQRQYVPALAAPTGDLPAPIPTDQISNNNTPASNALSGSAAPARGSTKMVISINMILMRL
ncbi:unnamed protein product [Amoebophrya sp. A25]|nr:unnamed protein product [Amoebophrya sp. A25]|eukprot:GSA25T00013831001.1